QNFGSYVTLDDHWAFVGTGDVVMHICSPHFMPAPPQAPDCHTTPGAAFGYRYEGYEWSLRQKISRVDAHTPYDAFGNTLSLAGDWLVVGAGFDSELGPNDGAAYFFKRQGPHDTWTLRQKVVSDMPDGTDSNLTSLFGGVRMDHGVAVIGDPGRPGP